MARRQISVFRYKTTQLSKALCGTHKQTNLRSRIWISDAHVEPPNKNYDDPLNLPSKGTPTPP